MGGTLGAIARAASGTPAINTVVLPPAVPVFFQRSPGFPQGDVRGIEAMDFQVLSGGAVIQNGRTGRDGRVDVRVAPGATVTLQLLVNGASVAEYTISLNTAAFDPVATLGGQQQRLRHMGYQIGHTGAGGDGVDPTQVVEFERGVLDFQADTGLLPDANIDAVALNALAAQNTAAAQAATAAGNAASAAALNAAAARNTAEAQRALATQNALTGPNGAGV